jgi:REP element-mobilizing transposase RayT
MIIAYHLILSAYGFWLPNDPRGSWSDFVGAWELFRYGGAATRVTDRRSYAHDSHDRGLRLATKQRLKFSPVEFNTRQIRSVALGIGSAIAEGGYSCHAFAMLPDHGHLLLGRSTRNIRQIAGHLKAKASYQLASDDLHPFQRITLPDGRRPSAWGERSWTVYIDDIAHLSAAIRYVETNPTKEGLSAQQWPFVIPDPLGSQASRLNGEVQRA